MSKEVLLEKLTDQSYREAFISDEIDIGIPMQIRTMREARGWKQKEVAEQTGTKQSRFSLMEKPGYGKFSLNTLKKLASIFDVGLIVSFVPFGEMIDFVDAISNRRLDIPSFVQEYPRLEKRYHRARRESSSTEQQAFNFTTSTMQPNESYQNNSTATVQIITLTGTSFTPEEIVDVPPYLTMDTEVTYDTSR